ncbi:MAG TPA: hypothetical protein VLA77_01885 [Candidatus Saccharimonadales bacterium]|nr:hypothetical protein [Candidatus Saccharimonadales bacterium]
MEIVTHDPTDQEFKRVDEAADPLSQLERDVENKEIGTPIDYETYRAFCDVANDGFRRIGILDPEAYEWAVRDKRTILCNIDGRTVPALVPLDYEARYNDIRTKEMVGKHEVMLLTIPIDTVAEANFSLPQILEGQGLRGDFGILVEQLHEGSEADIEFKRQELARQFAFFGDLQVYEFTDPRIDKPDNKTSWMAVYDFSFKSEREYMGEKTGLKPVDALTEAWKAYKAEKSLPDEPSQDSNATYLFTARELMENQRLLNDLWAISEVGFGEVLGAYHPISMEVTKSFFQAHVTSDEVLTSVKFVNGKAVCFGFLAPNMEYNDWMDCDSTVLKESIQGAKENGKQVAHFFELISGGEAGLALSSSIIDLFLELASRTEYPDWHVIFESTNLSDMYIPRIAELLIRRSQNVLLTQPVKKAAQLDYWCLAA